MWFHCRYNSFIANFLYINYFSLNIVIPCCKAFLENMVIPQLVKKFLALHRTQLKRASNQNLSRTKWIQSPVSRRILLKIRFSIVLPLKSKRLKGPTVFRLPAKTLFVLFIYPTNSTRPTPFSSLLKHCNNNWWRVQIMKLLIVCLFTRFCHFLCLGSDFSLKHPIPRQAPSANLPLGKRTEFNIQDIFWWHNFAYFKFFTSI